MIAIGCDHRGYNLKQEIMKHLKSRNMEFEDYGTYSTEQCDFPTYTQKVTDTIISGKCNSGILICGTGVGVSIAANRIKGIRAALCSDCLTAVSSRTDNNANVLALGAEVIGNALALKIIDEFFNTEFSNVSKYKKRLGMVELIDKEILK